MRPCISLAIFAILTASANAFPSPLSSSRAMPNNAVGVQGRRQLTSKGIGAGSDLVQQKAFGLRGGAVESVAAAASSSTSLSAGMSLVEACGLAAPIASIFVSLSPFPTVQKILKDKSVGDLPLLPYSSLVANWYVMGNGQVTAASSSIYNSHFAFEFLKSHYYPGIKVSFG